MPIDRNSAQYITGTVYKPTQTSAPGVWDLDDQANNIAKNLWPLPPNVIQRSLRFNSADSPSLSRTPGVASNRRTYTWSGWCKLTSFAEHVLFNAQANSSGGTQRTIISIASSGFLYVNTDNLNTAMIWTVSSNNLLRDFSAWYHIVVAVNTTQATAANRVRMYINGVEVSYAASTYPSQNYDDAINNAVPHYISYEQHPAQATKRLNAYLAEVNFVDGQALTPSSFGETDPQTGIWIPKVYTGTYGTNGFRLPFTNNSSTTALGFDASGRGNNWTPNNFSITPGSGNDSLLDVPSLYGTDTGLGGEVLGNYATLNSILPAFSGIITLSNGALDATTAAGGTTGQSTYATFAVSSGKWYWEAAFVQSGSSSFEVHIGWATAATDNANAAYGYLRGGQKVTLGTTATYGSAYVTGDVIGVALDLDAGTMTFYKNGVSQGIAFTGLSGTLIPTVRLIRESSYTTAWYTNFGQRPFTYPAPSGYKALCTTNLPAPAIGQTSSNQADNHFAVITYSGNGSTQNIVTDFAPDFVWIKNRTTNYSHMLYDTLRGPSTGSVSKVLSSNTTDAEGTVNDNSTYGYLSAFNQNGFTVTAGSFTGSGGYTNTSGQNYVAWCWNAGGVSTTNTAGTNGATITSTYRANPRAGFSIVTYTGNGTGGATIAHGLGSAPQMMIVRDRNNVNDWVVYHTAIGNGTVLVLNNQNGAVAASAGYWNNTTPNSNTFTVGTTSNVNTASRAYLAYCWSAIPGYSAFGSFSHAAAADGTFVYTGFRPKFLLLKASGATSNWMVTDSIRDPTNFVGREFQINLSNSEGSPNSLYSHDFVSNGFKMRNTGLTGTFIYMAFAETPARLSTAR